ncbi:MAG: AAA family ATPase [Candidatus Cloacimonetes bacterium]|nr:AAA family ATPase [Candidatus Cloacimonadota bacterium]
MGIKSIEIKNFKSIKDSGIVTLSNINVLIGANGAGKSNFVEFFELLKNISTKNLQDYVLKNGGADYILHFGRNTSSEMSGRILFDNEYQNEYMFELKSDNQDRLYLAREQSNTKDNPYEEVNLGSETKLLQDHAPICNQFLSNYLKSLRIYHFNNTSFSAKMKLTCHIGDYAYLYEDGSNIAAMLYRFKSQYQKDYNILLHIIKSVAPFLEDFYVEPNEKNKETTILRWIEKGRIFYGSALSDGTLRFICLATLLLFPEKPETIILDEPELGLHPFAIESFAELIKMASSESQIIITTQSTELINHLDIENIIVVKRENGETTLHRQKEEELNQWLEDYSIADVWKNNIIGGTPL